MGKQSTKPGINPTHERSRRTTAKSRLEKGEARKGVGRAKRGTTALGGLVATYDRLHSL